MENQDVFLQELIRLRKMAFNLNKDEDWLRRLDDLIFDVRRSQRADFLEKEWNPFFLTQIVPQFPFLQDKPTMKVVFGFSDDTSLEPNLITIEDAVGFSRSREFDPKTTDFKKLIQSFAETIFS